MFASAESIMPYNEVWIFSLFFSSHSHILMHIQDCLPRDDKICISIAL